MNKKHNPKLTVVDVLETDAFVGTDATITVASHGNGYVNISITERDDETGVIEDDTLVVLSKDEAMRLLNAILKAVFRRASE